MECLKITWLEFMGLTDTIQLSAFYLPLHYSLAASSWHNEQSIQLIQKGIHREFLVNGAKLYKSEYLIWQPAGVRC